MDDIPLIHHSYIYRDIEQLQIAIGALPALSRPWRVLSAGCAHGEELVTLAILAAERGGSIEGYGVDISPSVISIAQKGRYPQTSLMTTPEALIQSWFKADAHDARFLMPQGSRFFFQVGSIENMGEVFPESKDFDLVVCRNVLMYYPYKRRESIVAQLRARARHVDRVVLGASDRLHPPKAQKAKPLPLKKKKAPKLLIPKAKPSPSVPLAPDFSRQARLKLAASRRALKSHQLHESCRLVLEALDHGAEEEEALLLYTLALRKLGQSDRVLKLCTAVAQRFPKNWDFPYCAAVAAQALGEIPLAQRHARGAISIMEGEAKQSTSNSTKSYFASDDAAKVLLSIL